MDGLMLRHGQGGRKDERHVESRIRRLLLSQLRDGSMNKKNNTFWQSKEITR